MGGVVYAGGATPGLLGRYGTPIAIAINGIIPPGEYYVDSTFTVTAQDGTIHSMNAGLCISDGVNAVATAAGHATPLGAGGAGVWPWPLPWPL